MTDLRPTQSALAPDWQDIIQAAAVAFGAQVASALLTKSGVQTPASSETASRVFDSFVKSFPSASGSEPTELLRFSFLQEVIG